MTLLAYHYRASPLVQHYFRPPVGRYVQTVDLGDKLDGTDRDSPSARGRRPRRRFQLVRWAGRTYGSTSR